MSTPHVISALRAKRAEISGHIRDFEKRLFGLRVNLANVDATIRLFAPDMDPTAIAPKRPVKRNMDYERSELARRVGDLLREAAGPMSASELASCVGAAKGLPDDPRLATRVHGVLSSMARRGLLASEGKPLRWSIKPP